MTGFRVSSGGAQKLYGITPDLTTLGQRSSVAASPSPRTAAASDIMSYVAPSGPIYQAGTLSGNPLAVAGGLAMLQTSESHIPRSIRYSSKANTAKLSEAALPHSYL